MSNPLTVDLFAEDRAHEEFLRAMLNRIVGEQERDLTVRVRSARGGHPRVLAELALYQTSVLKAPESLPMPDLVCIAIDANCKPWNRAKTDIEKTIKTQFKQIAIIACPDPHIERWYLADPVRLRRLLESAPELARDSAREIAIRQFYQRQLSMLAIRLHWAASSSPKSLLQPWMFIALVKPKPVSNIFSTKLSLISKLFKNPTEPRRERDKSLLSKEEWEQVRFRL